MKKFLIILLLCNFILPIYAAGEKEQLGKAKDYYDLGSYNNAIKIYETLINDGISNSTIYYNLALSYIKNKDLGEAALNMERALRLAPRDKDIRALKASISKIINEPKQNIAEKFISQIKLIISLNEITFVVFVLFLFTSVFFIIYCLFYRKIYLNFSILFLVCFLLILPLLYLKVEDELLSKKAIITDYAEVRNNPIRLEKPSFEIDEGKKVIILSQLGRWVNVKLEIEGLSGWVDKHSLEII